MLMLQFIFFYFCDICILFFSFVLLIFCSFFGCYSFGFFFWYSLLFPRLFLSFRLLFSSSVCWYCCLFMCYSLRYFLLLFSSFSVAILCPLSAAVLFFVCCYSFFWCYSLFLLLVSFFFCSYSLLVADDAVHPLHPGYSVPFVLLLSTVNTFSISYPHTTSYCFCLLFLIV